MQHQYGNSGAEKSKYYDVYPGIDDLKAPARRRIPYFAWEYLDSGTGIGHLAKKNLRRLQAVEMVPQFMGGNFDLSLDTELMGNTYSAPFGIAPVGMTGLMWPGGEHMLARTSARHNIPYCLSSVACEAPETVGPLCKGNGWFQLYVPVDREMCADMLKRAWQAGMRTLVITADVPVPSARERQRKAGLKMPPDISLKTILRVAARPAWAWATLLYGTPRLRGLEKYAESGDLKEVSAFLGRQLSNVLNLEYIKFIREKWQGKIIVKGILHDYDAAQLVDAGVDGIIVSNHGGRQFDGGPAAIDVLPAISKAVDGRCNLLYDSGVRSGLDIIRALALGADFVLLGSAFIWGMAALGEEGGDHVAKLLKEDIVNNLKQLGVRDMGELAGCLRKGVSG